ncbi:MAG: tyrosine-type recombinase/integrase [Clostridium sp.]|nr:tyrosine-type recombinase/integrase [Clostridium sp.]
MSDARIVSIESARNRAINVSKLKKNSLKLESGLIAPATEHEDRELAPEHAAEPIKSMDDISAISDFLISNGRYRDNMLFIAGINFGLRVSDLRVLRFSDLINDNLTFKDSFAVFEQKTRNTRKRKKNRYIATNAAVVEAVTLYLEHTENVSLSDYMFRSLSNRGGSANEPLSAKSIDRILKRIAADLGLNVKVSTHTLRKTFCYHQMVMSHNDGRKLLLLQKMLGHSSPAQTLDYIGVTSEEIEEAYKKLNLGSPTKNYLHSRKKPLASVVGINGRLRTGDDENDRS